MALPNFLLIGAMRCGTTSLARHLRAHPDAFVSVPKEIRYFDLWFDRGKDWYEAHFARADAAVAIGEASPSYMYVKAAVPRMAALLPHAKLLAILRNPIDRAYSHYWHVRARGGEPLTFEEALAEEPSRLASCELRSLLDYSYIDRGRYLNQLQHVTTLYPRSSLEVILFEDLRDRPAQTYNQVCEFLGLDPDRAPPLAQRPANRYRRIRSVNIRRLSRRLPALPKRLIGRLNLKAENYPPMDPTTRSRLAESYSLENAALGDWLGRDLGVWRD